MVIHYKREIRFASITIALTLLCFAGVYHHLVMVGLEALAAGNDRALAEAVIFGVAMLFMAWGSLLYQICLRGHYVRKDAHRPARRDVLEKLYEGDAPALTVLIPSYKEERNVNWQTMLSAALAEYPDKNVVLLVDDPYRPNALEDIVRLEETRRLPGLMQALFDEPAARLRAEREAFRARLAEGALCYETELNRLAGHYDAVAGWLDDMAADYMDGKTREELHYADRFFVEAIIEAPAKQHRALARKLRYKALMGYRPADAYLARQYDRLVGLHTMRFSSFERKKYANLSHEANKAMNLNSYMSLIGKSWKEIETPKGLELHECAPSRADFTIPAADYVNTIDADSLMLSEYALRLIHFMEQPENARIAVIQSPCSSFPGCPNELERIAGACIDVQFLTHQGYTHWGASFWVGANAMLRKTALEDIREERMENGHPVSIYIQDHTVIEDTESSIDLVSKGWQLYNYPERMTFSATPPDFGSLLIQRRRWSNGGLLILPKLLRYVARAPKNLALFKEFFMRFQYLAGTTTACVVAYILFFYPFADAISTPWLLLSVVPFFALFCRDLKHAGHRYSDAWRVCALNLMLFPIVTGGVLKQFQQAFTGKKIPFSRTPKVPGRTAAPALYCLMEVIIPFALLASAFHAVGQERWMHAAFALLNASFFFYALVRFMGVKATLEDLSAGMRARWRTAFHKADVIPIHAMQDMPVPVQATATKQRA